MEITRVTVPEPSQVRTLACMCCMSMKHWYTYLQLISSEVSVEISDIEYMSHSEMVSIFTKAKNRPHFAALLIGRLIDEETRVKSNVW